MTGKRATRWCAATAAAFILGITSTSAGADDPLALENAASSATTAGADLAKPPSKPPTKAREQQQDEQKKRAQEEARRRAQDEAKKRAQEEARRRAQEEAKQRAQEEARRRAQEEAKQRAAEEARRRAQEEAKQRAAEQARQRAQEEARQRAAEQARERAQQEARERAAQQARERAQQEARERAAQQARERAQQEARERAAEQARDRAQQEARERAAEQARDRAQQEARERAATQARERAQQDARERAAEQARDRAQQEARERAIDEARRRADDQARQQAADEAKRRAVDARSRDLAEQAQRERAEDLARQRAAESARDRASESARDARRDSGSSSTRSTTPPARNYNNNSNTNDRTSARDPVRVDPEAAAALDRAVENARIRAEAKLKRDRATSARESSNADSGSGVIRITPRHEAEKIDPVEPGEIRISPSARDRFEVLREPNARAGSGTGSRSLSSTNVAEVAKREAQREAVQQREAINAGMTLPTRRYVDEAKRNTGDNRGSGNGGNGSFGNGGGSSNSGANRAGAGDAQPLISRGQVPVRRYDNHGSGGGYDRGGSSNYRDDHYFHDDFDHHDDRYYDRSGHHNFRAFCDDYGYRRFHTYDRWGYERSCSPWFSFHLFYGYRWRAYCDPFWDWWVRPGFSISFYYDYASPWCYYRPWYTDVRYVTTYQTVYRTEVEYIEVPVPAPQPAFTANDAWNLLAEGYYREARNVFSTLSLDRPEDGTLRIGYAIAAGLEFDSGASVFAMRRAIELDPISVRLVPVDSVLRRRILNLIDHYSAESRRNEFDRDAYFMVAALNTVIGEDGLAFFALDRALDLGDQEISTFNLESIVRQRMEDRMGNGG